MTTYSGDVTTGQALGQRQLNYMIGAAAISDTPGTGGPCVLFAAAGTYDISVQFKSSSGSVTVKNRKLWVETVGF